MNLTTEIARFFLKIKDDNRIGPVHISLFVAIMQLWNDNNFQNPVCVVGKELMRTAKISGSATYYRCINDLNKFGYIRYKPSHNCFVGSFIYLMPESEN